jgi:tetratricopeptide (TPR) repeat protein
MTKIEAFEKNLIKSGISDADYIEYEKLLRRVRGNDMRLQHVYITAVQFPKKHYEQAVALIRWGLQKYPDTWFGTYTAYYDIGMIYEKNGQYNQAYGAYLKADEALGEDHVSYRQNLAGNLMWMLLHIDKFRYSVKLEKYYGQFNTIDNFAKAFINNEFPLTVARIVIDLQHGRINEAKESYSKALSMSSPTFISRIQGVLNHHKATDNLSKNTPECVKFLKNLKL